VVDKKKEKKKKNLPSLSSVIIISKPQWLGLAIRDNPDAGHVHSLDHIHILHPHIILVD